MKLQELLHYKKLENALNQMEQVLKKKGFDLQLEPKADSLNIKIQKIPEIDLRESVYSEYEKQFIK